MENYELSKPFRQKMAATKILPSAMLDVEKPIGYLELSLFAFWKYNGGDLMKRVMVRWMFKRGERCAIEVCISMEE